MIGEIENNEHYTYQKRLKKYVASINNINEAYEKASISICNALLTNKTFISQIGLYIKSNKKYMKQQKTYKSMSIADRAQLQNAEEKKYYGNLGESYNEDRTNNQLYIDKINNWDEYENKKPSRLQNILKGVVFFDNLFIENFQPNATVFKDKKNSFVRVTNLCLSRREENNGYRRAPGRLMGIITLNYNEKTNDLPTVKFLKLENSIIEKLGLGEGIFGTVSLGGTIDRELKDVPNGMMVYFSNFNWDILTEYCNKILEKRPIPLNFVSNNEPIWYNNPQEKVNNYNKRNTMKKIYEEQELKNLIKGILKENIGEMAKANGRKIKFDADGNKVKDSYNRGILNNVEDAYKKGAEAVRRALYEVPKNGLIKRLQEYAKANDNYIRNLHNSKLDTDSKANDIYNSQRAVNNAGLVGEGAIPNEYYTDQIDWTEYENNQWKPEGIKYLMKGVVRFDTIQLFDFVPNITVTEVNSNKMYNAEDVHTENDGQMFICWRDGNNKDNRVVPGAVQAVITVNYGDENGKIENPTIQIAKFFSKASTDNFEGKLYAGAFVPLYDRYGDAVCGRTSEDETTGKKTCTVLKGGTQGERMVFENFDWEEFRKYCNIELKNHSIPSIDDRFIQKNHRPLWGLNKLNNDKLY